MGGRGSQFTNVIKGEIFGTLYNNNPTIVTNVHYLPNDEETQKLKKRTNIRTYASTDLIDESFLKANIKSINDHLEKGRNDYNLYYKYIINTSKSKHGYLQGAYTTPSVKAFTSINNEGAIAIVYNLRHFEGNNKDIALFS